MTKFDLENRPWIEEKKRTGPISVEERKLTKTNY